MPNITTRRKVGTLPAGLKKAVARFRRHPLAGDLLALATVVGLFIVGVLL